MNKISVLVSKVQWLNLLAAIGTVLGTYADLLPAQYGVPIAVGLALLNIVLRFFTKGEVVLALPSSLPKIPVSIQNALTTLDRVVGTLPVELGPRAYSLVAAAAVNPELASGSDKFDFVLNHLKEEFPALASSVLNTVVETLVLAQKDKDGVVSTT
jgi:hypothetical protein